MTVMRLSLSVFLTVIAFATQAFGGAVDDAKARMRERVPIIDALKRDGVVGENNRGYLEVRESSGNVSEVVTAENTDRQTIFADTATIRGVAPEVVGRIFSRQIAAASAPGVWLQRENGEWYKK